MSRYDAPGDPPLSPCEIRHVGPRQFAVWCHRCGRAVGRARAWRSRGQARSIASQHLRDQAHSPVGDVLKTLLETCDEIAAEKIADVVEAIDLGDRARVRAADRAEATP